MRYALTPPPVCIYTSENGITDSKHLLFQAVPAPLEIYLAFPSSTYTYLYIYVYIYAQQKMHTYNTRARAGAHKKQTKLEESQAQTTEAPPPAGLGGASRPPSVVWAGFC